MSGLSVQVFRDEQYPETVIVSCGVWRAHIDRSGFGQFWRLDDRGSFDLDDVGALDALLAVLQRLRGALVSVESGGECTCPRILDDLSVPLDGSCPVHGALV